MGKIAYTFALIVVGALVVHFAIILLLPITAPDAASRQLSGVVATPFVSATDLSDLESEGVVDLQLDPAFRVLACRYDVSENPVRITGGGRTSLWTFSVLDSLGISVFSANDRISPTPNIDVALLNSDHLRTFRQTPDPTLDNSIIVAPGDEQGFVIIRLFEPDDSWTGLVDAFVESIQCAPYDGLSTAQ